jgi:hypothetical protein
VIARALVVLVVVLLLVPRSTEAQTDPDALLARAREQSNAGQHAEALATLESAAEAQRTPAVVAELGLAHQALGHWVQAEALVEEALGHSGHPWVATHRAGLELALTLARRHIGRLMVTSSVDGTEIEIDGARRGVTPMREPIHLDPGVYTLHVSAAGHQRAERTVEIAAGENALALEMEHQSTAACSAGQVETGGHCCWPGQTWAMEDQACVGAPRCPTGLRAEGRECITDPSADYRPIWGGELAVSFGYLGFVDNTTSLWRPQADGSAVAYGGGFGTEIVLGMRPIWFLSAGIRLFYGLALDGTWFETSQGADPSHPLGSTFHALGAGIYVRGHTAEVFKQHQLDLWFGTGFDPLTFVIGQHTSDDFEPDASVMRGFGIPAQLGFSWYPADNFGLTIQGTFETWLPQEYGGETLDPVTNERSDYTLEAAMLEVEFSYHASAGFSFVF